MKIFYRELLKKCDIFTLEFRARRAINCCETICLVTAFNLLIFLTPAHSQNPEKPEICLQDTPKCAAPFLKRGGFVHGPTKAAGCTICHDAGKINQVNASGVRSDLNKVCLICHDELQSFLKKGPHSETGLHSAIQKNGCASCHDPHQSSVKSLLRHANKSEGCVQCHEPMKHAIDKGHHKTFHKEGCLSCHDPHQSKNQNLLKGSEDQLCLKCHGTHKGNELKKTGKIPEKTPLIKIGNWHHGQSSGKNLKCSQCHTVHGNDQPAFLKAKYSSETYQAFSDQSLKLCFQCHNAKLATETKENVKKITGFRNGDLNLHQLHIKGTVRKRSCAACHEVHASNQEMLMKTGFQTHGIKFPIKFEKNASGGNCTTACHQKYSYDREQPVRNVKNEAPQDDATEK